MSVTEADFRDVDAVLATVDTSAPVCLVFGCILHFFPAGEAASLLARYTAALAQGSYLVMCVISPVDDPRRGGPERSTELHRSLE